MDRLHRGELGGNVRDRKIEERALQLVRDGRDWLTAVLEATRELAGGATQPGRGAMRAAGRLSRSMSLPGTDHRVRHRGDRTGDAHDDRDEHGPTLSLSLRARLTALLGFDPARSSNGAEASASAAATAFTRGRSIEFTGGDADADAAADAASDAPPPAPVRPADKVRNARSLAETVALLDDPAIPADFARQAAVAHALRAAGPGQTLDDELQEEFGDRLGVSLDTVRVHDDPVSAQIVAALGSRAFAFGRHLFFAHGAYSPANDAGRTLIAHELAHVAQQPRGEATDAEHITLGRAGDAFEEQADDAAAQMLAGLRPQALSRAPVAARFDGGGGAVNPESVLRKHIGHDEGKARDALRQAGGRRAMVEGIVRGAFDKEAADKIISETKGGGGEKAPEVKGKGGDAKAPGKVDPNAGKGGQPKGPNAKGGGSGGGDAKGGAGPAGPLAGMCEELGINELTPEQKNLIMTELAEHQSWSAATSAVGAPGSAERAMFIAGQAARGFASGAATGLVMGVVMGAVGELAKRYCPIPGVGAMIAGGMAAYGLCTRDWGASRETISNIGQGASKWEVMANSVAAISEILDIVINVMNVIAGIIGLISAVMWLVTIITVGIASPLAGTLSAIALGILAVSGVLDNINNLILQPIVMVCRMMHTMQSDADPREIVGQGAKIADSASKIGSAVGGFVGGKIAEGGGRRLDARAAAQQRAATAAAATAPTAQPVPQPNAPAAAAPAPHAGGTPNAPTAQPHAPSAPPAGGTPNAPAAQPHGPNAPAQPPAGNQPEAPSIWQRLGLDARSGEQRAQDSQMSWRDRVRRNAGRVGEEFGNHRQRHVDRVIADQDRAQAERDAAASQRQQQIDEQHRQAVETARQANEARTEAEVRAHEETAARRNAEAEQRYREAGEANDTRLQRDADAAAQRQQQRHADADVARERSRTEHAARRGEIDARYEREMADAARLHNPDNPDMRTQAEERAQQRRDDDHNFLDRQERWADERLQQERDSADQRRRDDDSWALRDAERAQADRERALAETNQSNRERLEGDIRRSESRTSGRNRDAERDADRARARRAGEPEDARAAKQREQDAPEPGDSPLDYALPWRWGNIGRATKKHVQEANEGRGAEGGRRSLEQGDVSAREVDPGFAPGGGPIRDITGLDDRAKALAGLDKRKAEEKARDEDAQARDRNMGVFERIDRQLLHGEKSAQQVESDRRDNAQYRPDHQKNPNGERKNPNYANPPGGSLGDLDVIKQKLEVALQKQCEADAASKAMEDEKAKHQGNEAPLKGLQDEGKKAGEKLQEHKGEVKDKKAANTDHQAKQAQAEQKISDYDSKSAQFDQVLGPMRGVERFTYIGSKLGVGYFDDMNKQISSTVKGLEQASAQMKKEAAAQPANKAELKAKEGQITDTDTKATKSDTDFQKADTDVAKVKDDNTRAISDAGAAEAQATGQKGQATSKVSEYRQQYNAMATGLLGWATQHASARNGLPPTVEAQAGSPGREGEAPADGGNGAPGPSGATGPAGPTGPQAPAQAPASAGPAGPSGPVGPAGPTAQPPAAPPPAAPPPAAPPPAAPPPAVAPAPSGPQGAGH